MLNDCDNSPHDVIGRQSMWLIFRILGMLSKSLAKVCNTRNACIYPQNIPMCHFLAIRHLLYTFPYTVSEVFIYVICILLGIYLYSAAFNSYVIKNIYNMLRRAIKYALIFKLTCDPYPLLLSSLLYIIQLSYSAQLIYCFRAIECFKICYRPQGLYIHCNICAGIFCIIIAA